MLYMALILLNYYIVHQTINLIIEANGYRRHLKQLIFINDCETLLYKKAVLSLLVTP